MRDIDSVVRLIREAYPDISAEQLRVPHPDADDDGLWFIRHPASAVEIQLESPTGNLPFLVEDSVSSERRSTDTVQAAVAFVVGSLGLPSPSA
jgi:hypothetical protein